MPLNVLLEGRYKLITFEGEEYESVILESRLAL